MSDDDLPKELPLGCLLPLCLVLLLLFLAGAVYAFDGLTGERLTSSTATVVEVEPGGVDLDGERHVQCYVAAYVVGGVTHHHRSCDVTPSLDRQERRRQEDERFVEEVFAARHPVGSEVKVLRRVDPPYEARGPIVDPDITIGGGRDLVTVGIGAVVMLVGGAPLILLVLSKLRPSTRARRRRPAAPGAAGEA